MIKKERLYYIDVLQVFVWVLLTFLFVMSFII